MENKEKTEKIKVTVYIDKELMKALRHFLVDADRSIASAFHEALKDFLAKYDVKVKTE